MQSVNSDPAPNPPKRRKKGCLWALAILGVIFVLVGWRINWNFAAIRDIVSLAQKATQDVPQSSYAVSREANLKAIYTAMMLAHDSDGQFPDASSWMDAIKTRLRTTDLPESEAVRKLMNPRHGGPKEWGYAINPAVAGKFQEDIKNPDETPLIYESRQTQWNASGDPRSDLMDQGWAISVSGKILKSPPSQP